MAPFFGRLKGNAGATNPSVAGSPAKKDLHAPPMTPLEKMLLDSGPLQADGSDKFFGMENYGNTCYCNSILQCLYYSVPFRESVINYPKRTPIESLTSALSKNLQFPSPDAAQELDPSKPKPTTGNTSARSAGVAPNQPQKPEDKDSPEYKKKMAMQTLPVLETTDNSNSYGMPESLFTSMKDLFESVVASQFRMGVIRPQHFLDTLRREHEMFRTAMHQDAHEFLILLLNEVVQNVETESNRIESDKNSQPEIEDGSEPPTATSTTLSPSTGSKSPNTTRWVHELFEGTLTSETQCLTCEKVSQRDEVFLDLSVDLEQHSSVTSCLRKFSEEEMLCERNKFHCDNCGGLQEAEKRMKIKRLPRILALHLKRFKYTEDLQRLQKLFHRVVYPYHLRLFNTTDDAEDPDRLYELYAVVVHIGGGPYHGHYVAIIKTEDHGWLLFDDEMVEPVDKNYVRNFFGDRPGLACAYVLFYQETTLEAVQKEQEQEARNQARASSDIPTKMNGGPRSPELNRVNSAIPIRTSEDAVRWAALNHATSAPPLPTHPEHVFSTSPPVPPIPVAQSLPLGSKKSEVQLKKERQKEEKERKAAEKEKEKAEKQKRKDAELRLREAQRQQESDLKAAMEASKASKAEEDRRNTNGDAHHAKENGLTGSLGRFKRGSKSISHKLSTTVIKDKDAKREEPPSVPKVENAAREGFGQQATNNGSVAPPVKEPIRKDEVAHPPSTPDQEKHGHGHHKWKSFSLRKKSFSMLS